VTGGEPPAVLITHGGLGEELRRTAEAILGPQTGLAVVSNAGVSLEALRAELAAAVPADRPAVLFVDLLGGSCGHACLPLRREREALLVVSGVNLPMLLEFLYHRGRVPLGELRERILSRGRDGIRASGWEGLS